MTLTQRLKSVWTKARKPDTSVLKVGLEPHDCAYLILRVFKDLGVTPPVQADIDEFNSHAHVEFDRIRDFLILHYHATERSDTPFWDYVRNMDIPESLQRRMDLFRSNARIFREGNEMFAEPSWLQVMHGQRMQAEGYHPLVDLYTEEKVAEYIGNIRGVIGNCVAKMPTHDEFIARHCAI